GQEAGSSPRARNDRKKGKSRSKRRSPTGMTTRKPTATAKTAATIKQRHSRATTRDTPPCRFAPRMGHPIRDTPHCCFALRVGYPDLGWGTRSAALAQGDEGGVVVFGDADVAGGEVVDPAGDGEVAEGHGGGDGRVRLEVLDLEEDVLLGEEVDEGAFGVGLR